MDGHQQVLIHELLKTLLSVQFINTDFFRWTRPHPAKAGFAERRTLCTPQPETRYDRQASGKKAIYGWTLSHLFAQREELSKNLVIVEAL